MNRGSFLLVLRRPVSASCTSQADRVRRGRQASLSMPKKRQCNPAIQARKNIGANDYLPFLPRSASSTSFIHFSAICSQISLSVWLVDCAASSRHSSARARDVARSVLDILATCSACSGRAFGTVRRRQLRKFVHSRTRPATMKKVVSASNKAGIMKSHKNVLVA